MAKIDCSDGYRPCAKCKRKFPLDNFGKQKSPKTPCGWVYRAWCLECRVLQARDWRLNNKIRYKESYLKCRDKLKLAVMSHYGIKGKAQCVICGFDNLKALCLDHIDNNGHEHRKSVSSGKATYTWVRKNNFPEGFQTLCANCNLIKEVNRVKNNG